MKIITCCGCVENRNAGKDGKINGREAVFEYCRGAKNLEGPGALAFNTFWVIYISDAARGNVPILPKVATGQNFEVKF
jgi:hypothetical protein